MSQDHRVGENKGARGVIAPHSPFLALFEAKYSSSVDLLSTPLERLKVTRGWILLQPFFLPPQFLTFRRPCTIDFYDDNNSSAAKDDSNTAGGAQSLQRMDSAPAFFLLFKLLGKVFRTMTITKGLWGRATLTMDQKFEIGTPLMRNFLFFSFPSFFFLFSTVILS